MKVIFVIQGEGRGHLTQALALKQMLLHEGHEVVKVLVGKSKNRVIPEFFMNQIGTPIELFNSPNFLPSKDNRKFNLLRSLVYNTLLAPSYLSSIHLIRKNIQESGADIIINFYEVLCGITCSLFRFGIPEVCIGHQYLFLHPSFQMPGKYPVPESLLKFFTRITCVGATAKLALSIRDYEEDVEFRMWENHADTRIIAAIENAYDTYYHKKENQAYEEENDSIVAASSSLVVPARRVWQG